MVSDALSSASHARALDAWAARLRVPPPLLESPGAHLVPRPDLDAVIALEVAGACAVVAPPDALDRLRTLDVDALLDTAVLAARLADLGARPIGVATLAWCDQPLDVGGRVRPASPDDVARVRGACSEDAWAESGLADHPHLWTIDGDDSPGALAGYAPWGEEIAQLGVLTAPPARRRGLATAVAGAATRAATDAGLVAQWRASITNPASAAVARRLGFEPVGRQAAVALG